MSTTRATMKHAAVYSAAALAGRMIGFIMLPFYAHLLRGQGYAVIGMLDVGLGFLLALLVYGLQGSIIRLYHDEKDPARKTVVVSTGVILVTAVTAVLSIPMILLSKPISAFLIDDSGLYYLTIMALLSFNLEMIGQAASSWLLVRSRSMQMAGLSLLRLFVGLLLNIYLVLIKDMGLTGYFISSLTINLLSCVIFVWIAFRDCGREYDPTIARTIRGFLLPLIPGTVASWIGRQVERILAKILIGLESVGIMEMGYKFPVLISMMIIKPFMDSWETRRFEIADEPGAAETISRMFTYFMFILSWTGLVLAVVIKPLLEVMTPVEFHPAYRIARVEVLTVILVGAVRHLNFGMAYAKNTAMISKVRTSTAVVKVVLSWFFISTWGIYGAAFSAVVVAAITVVLFYYFSQKHYHLDLQWNALASIAVLGGGLFVVVTQWDVASFGVYGVLNDQFLPWINDGLRDTFLGTWKDGKVITKLTDRSGPVSEMIINGTVATSFIALLPVIHAPTRRKWIAKVRNQFS
jgi:O-antigen/teichoic acid export membrane protein